MADTISSASALSGAATLPADELSEIFDEAPILSGEDRQAYQSLKVRLFNSVSPADLIEQIWVYDILNFTWESKRLRGLKVKLMTASSHEGVRDLLRPMVDPQTREELVKKWALNEDDSVKQVLKLFDRSFLDEGAINAQVLLIKLDALERIDELIARTDARRNTLIQEIERRREALARRIREATAVEDAEFKELEGAHQEAAE